ncbi:MAG TPA: hypothetical protein VGB66_02540 [Longimicrobium sp.]
MLTLVGMYTRRRGRRDGDASPRRNDWAIGTTLLFMTLGVVVSDMRVAPVQADVSPGVGWLLIVLLGLVISLDIDRTHSWARDAGNRMTDEATGHRDHWAERRSVRYLLRLSSQRNVEVNMVPPDTRELDRLMRLGRTIQILREYSLMSLLPVMLLRLVVGDVMLYVGSAYLSVIVVLAWGLVPRLAPRIREVARALYAAGCITTERYNEAAVLVNNMLFQGPPRPDDKPPMPLRH